MYQNSSDDITKPLKPKTYLSTNVTPAPAGSINSTEGGQDNHGHGHSHGNFSKAEMEHAEVGDGGLRAAVFGFSDGLVTNLCLILGVDLGAGDVQHRTVVLTGIAGLLAGACSMAIGEWISMKFQQEALDAQLKLEQMHLKEYPRAEASHFRRILKDNGLSIDACEIIARDLEKTTIQQQVKWHALLELKIDPEELGGSPWKAAGASFIGFTVGAFIPLVAWICTEASKVAFYITIGLSIFCVLLLGILSGVLYKFPMDKLMVVVVRQLVLVAVACGVVVGVNNGVSRLV